MSKYKDPYIQRESQKYDNPIPSRELIMEVLGKLGIPMSLTKLADELNLTSELDLEALRRRLGAMERDGQLIRNRKKGYGLVDKMDLIKGRIIGHPDGFGFLVPDKGGQDLFVSARQMRTTMHGDRVVARISGVDRRGRKEAVIVEVIERAKQHLVGRFVRDSGVAYVVPENRRITQEIIVPGEYQLNAQEHQIVMVEITQYPGYHRQPIGQIVEILGDSMAPGLEIDIAIRDNDLPHIWPIQVLQEIDSLDAVHISPDFVHDREDLTDIPLVTIDGDDAKDFDDAVYCERYKTGWRLLVAIADVSFYVKPNTALDEEALKRGNSVYFPERVIPMLPDVLSNGLCSLNPNLDRLCMVCEIFFTGAGKVRRYRFFEAVMRSKARLTYTKVAAALDENNKKIPSDCKAVLPNLLDLFELYKLLLHQREKRGALDFARIETKIVFGQYKKIEKIVPVERNNAHRLIEEFMIAANVCAANFVLENKIPALLRVHEGPSGEKLTDLRKFLFELGFSLGGGDDPKPKHIAKLIDATKNRIDSHLIQTVLLRSLKQAQYSPENNGHFGLSFAEYAHFTSPIRRYPDLLLHRAIKHLLRKSAVKQFPYSKILMAAHGVHCSMTERRADDATRDVIAWLKCEYMTDKVGERFDGIITGVTAFGLFVELDNIYVEGLVHVTSLKNDYYHFDPTKHRLIGERTHTVYRLADKLSVRVIRVDLDDRKIDFELTNPTKSKPKIKRKRRK